MEGAHPVHAVAVDLSAPEELEQAMDHLPERVDVLVNSAGRRGTPASETGLKAVADRWRQDFDNNVLPVVLLTEVLLPRLARPGGRVVSIVPSPPCVATGLTAR
ncbi:SDR family NAD(P)-dependent oxidoreductase [Streptomyces sp. NPDC008125]|uniref:SDR family oxidoreductase n=1 Tax=Streptomyces sp. NPDC008125 TaxID=3364811 RepID=UPI0036E8836B